MKNLVAMKLYEHFINGEYRSSPQTFETINPATGQPIGEAARGTKADIDNAVQIAQDTFSNSAWPDMDGRERGQILRKVAQVIRHRAEQIIPLEVADAGKTLADARLEVEIAAQVWDYYADLTQSAIGTVNAVPAPDQFGYTVRQPAGVIGIIIPWNFPFVLTALKVAPALAAGNTAVMKPAEDSPITASLLGDFLNEAGIPAGVANIVQGLGEEAGAALAANPSLDKLVFTGSSEIGSLVMQTAGKNITDVTLELGGKSANIICADADREQALMSATFGCLLHCGQCCCAGTRLLVEKSILESFLDDLEKQFERIRVGDPTDEKTHIGPIINNKQLTKIDDYVEVGRGEGATVMTGGERATTGELGNGLFYKPTILANANNRMRIAQEEIFGPVITCIGFEDLDEAIAIANDSTYGLAAGVCTRDLVKAHYAARRLEAGTVWINTFNGLALNSPFLGWKKSGIGVERGIEGLHDHMRLKSVRIDMSQQPLPVFGD
ncbi:MAG: betaine-aldehyde dehydrogenase [Phycisphaeraceae bacterium]|nr:betaine-aldehyde dehydrogenase [Phycisphaeraceae bacterium]